MPMTKAQWLVLVLALTILVGAVMLGVFAMVLSDLPNGVRIGMLAFAVGLLLVNRPLAKYALTSRS